MASNASPSSNLPQKRKAVSDKERFQIRKRSREHPGSQVDLIKWFYAQSGHKLDQSQISRILSSKYDYLDNTTQKQVQNRHRVSKSDWPDLEAALYEWQQRLQKKDAVITGEILQQQAIKLWQALPQYQNQEQPKFSNGWLEGFKKRFKIREYVKHGEGGSADINSPENIHQMEKVRKLAAEYGEENTLNMDETGLFWKLSPDRTLATQSGSGGKKSKDRVTLAFTCSAAGERLQPWLIGKSKNPRCFKKSNQSLFRLQYRYNKTKWMTGLIMEEYLRWLDNKMRGEGRKVLLLLDNFSGHELGIQLVGGLEGLNNVRIEWLPPNTTSHWQPLDQGIIASFKLQYRRFWVHYMLQTYEKDKDPNKTVNLLKTIQWSRAAWEGLSAEMIQRCWWKSTIFKKPEPQDKAQDKIQADEYADREDLQAIIARLPYIQNPLPVDEFINPPEERIVEDEDSDIFEQVVERYGVSEDDIVDMAEDGVVQEEDISVFKAIEALETLKLFEIQQEDGSEALLHALDQAGTRYIKKKNESRKQVTIDSFFKAL
jgi:hypothetical protein